MVIFKISNAGIAQPHPENHNATNTPYDLFTVTTNLFVLTTNGSSPYYKQIHLVQGRNREPQISPCPIVCIITAEYHNHLM